MREDELWVGLDVTYSDMSVIEFALVDFIDNSRKQITSLQDKNENNDIPRRKELIKIYENRVKKAKYVLGHVSVVMDKAAKDFMPEELESTS